MGGLSKLEGAADLVGRLAGQAPEPKLLTYNPGPGIYSRLERAVEAMPENVRAQELPGLLKRYKDGVPGWELKAVDLDSVVAGRDVVPRQEILDAVRQRSPVYTHKELVLGGRPQYIKDVPHTVLDGDPRTFPFDVEDVQPAPSAIGRGVSHGDPKFESYGQGGKDYTELLLTQPGAVGSNFGGHWSGAGGGYGTEAVAHARFDTHGDALRINEVQSDLGIHNRKVRENNNRGTFAWDPDYLADLDSRGIAYTLREDGSLIVHGDFDLGSGNSQATIPFPLEDVATELLIKRMALEAARGGHRAIEIASPRAIADKVGGNIENYEHAYGKVARGNLERLGRKMGGLNEELPPTLARPQRTVGYELPYRGGQDVDDPTMAAYNIFKEAFPPAAKFRTADERAAWRAFDIDPAQEFRKLARAYTVSPDVEHHAVLLQSALFHRLRSGGMDIAEANRRSGERMPELVRLAEEQAERSAALTRVQDLKDQREFSDASLNYHAADERRPGFRGILSDEMRRRIILEGIPASVAGAIGTDQILDRLDRDSPQPQLR